MARAPLSVSTATERARSLRGSKIETWLERALSVATGTARAALSVATAMARAALSVGVKIEVRRELL